MYKFTLSKYSDSRRIKFGIPFILAVLLMFIIFYNITHDTPKENVSVKTETIVPFRIDGELEFLDSLKKPFVRLSVEIADDEYEITTGLMYRKTMADSVGMLFIFPTSEQRSFWMKNTFIPLDIIYVNEKLEIISIQKYTQPFSEAPLPSGSPAQYVIEVNAGYCDRKKIKIGQTVQFLISQS